MRGDFLPALLRRWGFFDWIACSLRFAERAGFLLRGITQVTTPRYRVASFSFLLIRLSKLSSFAKKKNPQLMLRVTCCPTWIRTKTY
jgi:hypothetical protein